MDRRPISPHEAHTVSLSWRPIKRLGQLAELGATLDLESRRRILPQFPTRNALIFGALERARIDDQISAEVYAFQNDIEDVGLAGWMNLIDELKRNLKESGE